MHNSKIAQLLVLLCIGLSISGCSRETSVEWTRPSLIMEEGIWVKQSEQVDDAAENANEDESAESGKLTFAEVEEQALAEFEEAWADTYAYDKLSQTEQLWYSDMNRILGNMLKKQELSQQGLKEGLSEKDIDKIFQCVLNDHPEYFYVEGYTYTCYTRLDKVVKVEFSGTYSMEMEEAIARREQIKETAEGITMEVPVSASDYEKIKYVYEYLIRSTEYNLEAPDNQNIYSVFVNRSSVCQGYAKATQYLLNRLGVKCTLVTGTVDTGEGHAWNLVKADGEYYYVDTTWGDASYLIEEDRQQDGQYYPEINYDYLCITTEQLLRTHTLGNLVSMPLCESTEDNYFVKEGVYFTEVDEERLAVCFQAVADRTRTDLTIKCSDSRVYDEMYRMLIADQKIFDYMECEEGSVAYARNEKQLSMTFWLAN